MNSFNPDKNAGFAFNQTFGCGGPQMDLSHNSGHFLKGAYDHAITQRGYFGNSIFHTYTDVDPLGNVLDSGFRL